MTVRIYVRASTKEQDAERALADLLVFSTKYGTEHVTYIENFTGTKRKRPQLNRLLAEAKEGDILLVESVDRLSRLEQSEFKKLKQELEEKGLRLIVADLPTTHMLIETKDEMTGSILTLINGMLIDLLATMARIDQQKRVDRIKQGLERSGYKPTGKKANTKQHKEIIELLNEGKYTKVKISKIVGCSEQQVYKVAKQYKDRLKSET